MSHFCTVVFCKNVRDIESILAPYQENNMGDVPERYLSFFENEDCDIDPKTGKHGYWENPNKKWDWWQVGGRYRCFFRTLGGQIETSIAQLREIDFSPNLKRAKSAEREWDIAVNGAERTKEEEHELYYRKTYYLEQWGDKESFVAEASYAAPWAFVTPDGVWYEKGRMGWWAANDATNDSRTAFLKEWEKAISEIPKDYYAVAVDCHI